MLQSNECALTDWRARSWYHRWREWFWGRIENLLDRLSEQLHRRKGNHKNE